MLSKVLEKGELVDACEADSADVENVGEGRHNPQRPFRALWMFWGLGFVTEIVRGTGGHVLGDEILDVHSVCDLIRIESNRVVSANGSN